MEMKSIIKNILNFVFGDYKSDKITKESFFNDFISFPSSSNIANLTLSIRNPVENKKYLIIGENCLINFSFVFEKQEGIVTIGNRTFLGGGMCVCIDEIHIGNDVMISWGCTIVDNNSHSHIWKERENDVIMWKKGIDENKIGKYKDWSNVKKSKVTIKDKVWIGFNCIILKGVTIGEGAIIGSGSVVSKDVPDWTIFAGNPAGLIRQIPEDER
jgi:acetyltransferase-like isoleucine patch superfamily enzyme